MKKFFKGRANSSIALKVRVYWGDILFDTVLCDAEHPVTIGRDQGVTFVLDLGRGNPHTKLPLLCVNPDGTATLKFDQMTEGHVRIDGKMKKLDVLRTDKTCMPDAQGFYSIPLTQKDKASVVVGYVSFEIDWVKEFVFIDKEVFENKKQLIFGSVSAGAAVLLLALLSVPVEKPEEQPPPERLVEILPPKEFLRAKAAMGQKKSEEGGAQAGEAGKADTAPPKEEEKPSAAESLRNANLGSLASNLSSLTGTAPSNAPKPTAVNAAIEQQGTGGFTTEGLAKGAGGKSVGIGRTVGQGEGGFEGTGKLGLSGNSLVEGSAGHGVRGPESVKGGLDRDVVDQIVRRRQDRIRLCYARQLNFNPKLAGKVTVQFIIGVTGNVEGASLIEDTMKNDAVRDCITQEVRTWTFPAPKGETSVKVDYPFVFESGGG